MERDEASNPCDTDTTKRFSVGMSVFVQERHMSQHSPRYCRGVGLKYLKFEKIKREGRRAK